MLEEWVRGYHRARFWSGQGVVEGQRNPTQTRQAGCRQAGPEKAPQWDFDVGDGQEDPPETLFGPSVARYTEVSVGKARWMPQGGGGREYIFFEPTMLRVPVGLQGSACGSGACVSGSDIGDVDLEQRQWP